MKRTTLISLLLLITAELLLGGGLYWGHKGKTSKQLDAFRLELNTSVNSITDSYRRAVELVFLESINQPDILDLMAKANQASSTEQRKLRGRLYRKLFSSYEHLQQSDVRVLQFVLRNGDSFLRFNRPDLYDDAIAADRPVLARVLETGEAAWAFENGRVYPGFRYAFPMHKDGKVIGVADFSVSFEALHRVIHEVVGKTNMETQFIFRHDLNQAVSHPSSHSLYRDTAIHPAYITEDTSSSHHTADSAVELEQHVEEVDAALGESRQVSAAINAGQPHSLHICPNGNCYGVVLRPVSDSHHRIAGYIIAYIPTPAFISERMLFLAAFLLGTILLISTSLLSYRWLESRSRLRTISESMAQGMYVMDAKGRTLYINQAAASLLGYAQEEVTGRDAHDLFHVHSDGKEISSEECPIRTEPLSGKVFSSRNEEFMRKDQSTFLVEVTASPLAAGGEITGSVVLFRDITEEHEVQRRLQQTDIAFRNLSEAVMVANAEANIIAVNDAFSAITGYDEIEVVGHNPGILSSGRHDRAYYKDMWESLTRHGFWEGEIWNRRKDGEIYPEWLNITAVRDDEGTLINYISVFSDITELRRKEERLRDLAYHDQLTGLPNRAYFHELFDHALERARRHNTRLAILYLDLDRFKQINDSLGHVAGDTLLQQAGKRLVENTRTDDEVARLGGDEFCVLLDNIEHNETPARVARKLINAFKKPFSISSKELYITPSIGISIYPEDGGNTTVLLRNADAAMYLAKQAGRNDYRYFTRQMAKEAAERFQLEVELREALEGSQFEVYYQPKVQLPTGEIIGLEALLRWNHPKHGVLSPNRFIKVARDAGFIEAITESVVRRVAQQVSRWKEAGVSFGRVAVNIDTESFLKEDIVERLVGYIDEEGGTPEDIELEVVEGSMDPELHTTDLWAKLVDAGFALSIDDFGTGESSLSRLKLLPVETLKVDQSFVRDIEANEDDRTIIRAIIAMGKNLGLKVLAEGVEESAQLHFLYRLGCDSVQGYYFAEPLSAATITELLMENDFPARCQVLAGD